MTFLTVYTPTFRRPTLLEQCKSSVANQSVPVEHVIVHDEVGIGIDGMYASIRDHVGLVHGDYVMVLSDDNVLVSEQFAALLEGVADENGRPPVIVFRGQIESTLQPAAWDCAPVETQIDLSCFAVRRDVWVENADKWGQHYCGDFTFIRHLWDEGHEFAWWDFLAFRALQISRGAPE